MVTESIASTGSIQKSLIFNIETPVGSCEKVASDLGLTVFFAGSSGFLHPVATG